MQKYLVAQQLVQRLTTLLYHVTQTHKVLLSTPKSSSESDRNKEGSSLMAIFLSLEAPYFTTMTTTLLF